MRAGSLRHTLSIYDPSGHTDTSPDKYGHANDAAVLVATVRADIMPLRGREYFDAKMQQSSVTHRIRIRHVDSIKTRMYGVDENNVTYDFESILDDGYRGRQLTIMAVERDV